MKILSLAAFCVVACLSSFGQNWQPGTLYLHNGDSISGEVDFEDWKVSPASITFRNNGVENTYGRRELNSFVVGEKTQRYQLVRARLKYFSRVAVKAGSNPTAREDSVAVYAEVLYLNPNLALYSLQDLLEDERLFIMKDGQVRELIHFTTTFEREGRTFNQENNSYREQLKQLLKDCEVNMNSDLVYSSRAIIPVLRKYSSCKGDALAVERVEKKGLVNVGIFGGRTFGRSFKPPAHAAINAVGIDLQILSKRFHNNNFIWLEAGVITTKFDLGAGPLLYPLVMALYGGRYFGNGKIQPLVFTGLSSVNRVFDTGAGVSLNKRVIVTGSFGGLQLLTSTIQNETILIYSFKLKFYPRLRF